MNQSPFQQLLQEISDLETQRDQYTRQIRDWTNQLQNKYILRDAMIAVQSDASLRSSLLIQLSLIPSGSAGSTGDTGGSTGDTGGPTGSTGDTGIYW